MRILVTNDDSVSAAGLIPLIRWAQTLGQVTVAVPKFEQSGKSHGIELRNAYTAEEVELEPGLKVWAVDSTPADCVRFAVMGLHLEFDLCISGINRGFNIGSDMIYSGTVGAACEANTLGIPAIALSTSIPYYLRAHEQLDRVWDYVCRHKLLDVWPLYNINLPENADQIRITRQGGPYFSDDYVCVGENLYKAAGKCVYQDNGDETLDTNTVMHGHISICPITIDRTNYKIYDALRNTEVSL